MHIVVVDILVFLENISTKTRYFSFKDKLSLSENISVTINHKYNKDIFFLREDFRYSFANKHYFITDHLSFTEKLATPKDLEQFYDVLDLDEEITVRRGDFFSDNLLFFEHIRFRHFKNRQIINDIIVFDETIAFAKFKNKISINSQTPGITSTDCPVYVHEYPYITFLGNGSITLNAPDKGNTDTLNLGRINRRSRGGDLILKRVPLRPRDNILKYTLHIYNRTDRDKVKDFFKLNWGKVINLVDHEGVSYNGVLMNAPEFIEELNCCYIVNTEFLAVI